MIKQINKNNFVIVLPLLLISALTYSMDLAKQYPSFSVKSLSKMDHAKQYPSFSVKPLKKEDLPVKTLTNKDYSKLVIGTPRQDRWLNFVKLNDDSVAIPLYQENHHNILNSSYRSFDDLNKIDAKGYSILGIATAAVYVYTDLNAQHYPKMVSYEDKKIFIKELLTRGFKPTEQDRELALKVQQEEALPIIDNKSDLFDQ